MAPSPLLASSIVLCLVPVQIQSHITGVSKLSTNRRACRRMQWVQFLTAVVGLQLRGRVDSHLAEGAVEEAYSFLFLRLLLRSNPYISIFLCLLLRRRQGFRGHLHSFSGAAAQRCRLRGRVWGWGFCNKPRIKQSNVTLISQSTQSSVRARQQTERELGTEGAGWWEDKHSPTSTKFLNSYKYSSFTKCWTTEIKTHQAIGDYELYQPL